MKEPTNKDLLNFITVTVNEMTRFGDKLASIADKLPLMMYGPFMNIICGWAELTGRLREEIEQWPERHDSQENHDI